MIRAILACLPIPPIWNRVDFRIPIFPDPREGSPIPKLRSLCLGVSMAWCFLPRRLPNGLWLVFVFSSLNSVSRRLCKFDPAYPVKKLFNNIQNNTGNRDCCIIITIISIYRTGGRCAPLFEKKLPRAPIVNGVTRVSADIRVFL